MVCSRYHNDRFLFWLRLFSFRFHPQIPPRRLNYLQRKPRYEIAQSPVWIQIGSQSASFDAQCHSHILESRRSPTSARQCIAIDKPAEKYSLKSLVRQLDRLAAFQSQEAGSWGKYTHILPSISRRKFHPAIAHSCVPNRISTFVKVLGSMYPAIPKRRFFIMWLPAIWRPSSPDNGSETEWCHISCNRNCGHSWIAAYWPEAF